MACTTRRTTQRVTCALAFVMAVAMAGCGLSPTAALKAGAPSTYKAKAEDVERATAIDRALDSVVGRKTTRDNDLELHVDGDAAFGALRNLIESAQKSIWIETFIWHNDATGIAIAQLLRKRALEGIDVRVLADSAGTLDKEEDRNVLRILQDRQVPVRLFNPYLVEGANMHVTHRKLYLADGNRALTGGMNIGNEYEHDWHDLLVEVKGSAARHMHAEFVTGWNHSKDGPEEPLIVPQVSGAAAGTGASTGAGTGAGPGAARVAITSPFNGEGRSQEIKNAFSVAMRTAKKRIRTFHVYVSDPDFIDDLARAAKRGVEVELLFPADNDIAAFTYIDRHYGGKLMDAGAAVKLYDKRFSHVKYLSVDGAWVSIGSANADSRSLYSNEELCILSADPAFTHEADTKVFERDWAASRWPTYADLHVPLVWKPVVTLAQLLAYYI